MALLIRSAANGRFRAALVGARLQIHAYRRTACLRRRAAARRIDLSLRQAAGSRSMLSPGVSSKSPGLDTARVYAHASTECHWGGLERLVQLGLEALGGDGLIQEGDDFLYLFKRQVG